MSLKLKLNTPFFPNLAAPSLFPNSNPSEIRFSNRWGIERKVERSLSLSLLDQSCRRRRRDQIRCGMAAGDHHHLLETGVWWDLNTCPVPAGFDPRFVRPCIESALAKQIGRPSSVSIYAFGNLDYISSDLLQKISSSGIILTHAPLRGHDLDDFLDDWSGDELKNPHHHPRRYIMMVSGDYEMLYPERFRRYGFTTFVAYPEDDRLIVPLHQLKVIGQDFAKVFAEEFVWETLLSDNLGQFVWETLLSQNNRRDEKPLCICNTCNEVYQVCDEFITHLKSEEHINKSFEIVANRYGKPKYICQVCNYPAHALDSLFLHNERAHNHKLVQKQDQEEEEVCENMKTYPELDFFY